MNNTFIYEQYHCFKQYDSLLTSHCFETLWLSVNNFCQKMELFLNDTYFVYKSLFENCAIVCKQLHFSVNNVICLRVFCKKIVFLVSISCPSCTSTYFNILPRRQNNNFGKKNRTKKKKTFLVSLLCHLTILKNILGWEIAHRTNYSPIKGLAVKSIFKIRTR